jgi:hypothetical protein
MNFYFNDKLIKFLYNVNKSNSLGENEENEELCPICQSNLGFEVYLHDYYM